MLMNKSFRFLLVAAALLIGSCGLAQAQGRMASVDLVKVFTDYWKTKQSKLALEESKTEIKKDFEAMQDAHKKLVQQYQKLVTDANDQAVSGEERDKRKKALEPRAKELQESETNLKQFYTRSAKPVNRHILKGKTSGKDTQRLPFEIFIFRCVREFILKRTLARNTQP